MRGVEGAQVERVAHVEVVIAVIVIELFERAGVVADGARFVRPAARALAEPVGVLGIQRDARRRSARERELPGVVAVATAAGLVVDLRERRLLAGNRRTRTD